MYAQAWTARRCISEFNQICRRPHQPREPEIKSLIATLEIKLPEKKTEECDEDEDLAEEEEEEEECEDDPVDATLEGYLNALIHSTYDTVLIHFVFSLRVSLPRF